MAALPLDVLPIITRRCDFRTLACLVCANKELQGVVGETIEELNFAPGQDEALAWRLDCFPRLKRLSLHLWQGGGQLYGALGLPALRSGLTSLSIDLRRERTAGQPTAAWGTLRRRLRRGGMPCLLGRRVPPTTPRARLPSGHPF
jgi:hypothetical protein